MMIAGALLGAMTLTTALLSMLSPRPLAPEVSGKLFVTGETPRSLDFEPVFRTRVPLRQGYWSGIIIRTSGTDGGDPVALAEQARARGISGPPDHFVVGNGQGMSDGEVQFTVRWADQLPAALVIDGGAGDRLISVCVIADPPRLPLTATQEARLSQLVAALRGRLSLPEGTVLAAPKLLTHPASP